MPPHGKTRMISRLPYLYLLAGGILTAILVLELAQPTKATAPSGPIRLDHFEAPPRHSLRADGKPRTALATTILARPLFSPSRRPPPPSTRPNRNEATPRLSGVIVFGSERLAIFAPHGGKPIIAAEGGHVGDWIVSAVQPDGATLTGPRGSRRLLPSFATTPATPPDLATAPAPDPTARAIATSRRTLLKLLHHGPSAAH